MRTDAVEVKGKVRTDADAVKSRCVPTVKVCGAIVYLGASLSQRTRRDSTSGCVPEAEVRRVAEEGVRGPAGKQLGEVRTVRRNYMG